MDYKKNHFRQILLYYFFRKKSAAQATRILREVYGDEALKERQCRNWFTRFRAGDFSLKDEPHTGRPHEVVDDEIKAIIEADPQISIRGLGDKLQVHFSTIDRHLQRLGYVKEHNAWILRETEFASTSRCHSTQKKSTTDKLETSFDPLEDTATTTIDAQISCDVPLNTTPPAEKEAFMLKCKNGIDETHTELMIKNCDEVPKTDKMGNKDKRTKRKRTGRIQKPLEK